MGTIYSGAFGNVLSRKKTYFFGKKQDRKFNQMQGNRAESWIVELHYSFTDVIEKISYVFVNK